MKTSIHIILCASFLFVTCRTIQPKDDCNLNVFYTVDSALSCGGDSKEYKSLLFALVSKDVGENKKLGWNILRDPDIIDAAKRDYVLIIIDPKDILLNKRLMPDEFSDMIRQARQEPYFIVTNRVFYPFREFYLNEDKDRIINDLNLGEGP